MTENYADRIKIIAGIEELIPGDILVEDIEYTPGARSKGVAFARGRHITPNDVESLANHSAEIRTHRIETYRRLEEVESRHLTRENFAEYTDKLCHCIAESGAFSDAYE